MLTQKPSINFIFGLHKTKMDFKEIKPFLDELRKQAENQNRGLIFIKEYDALEPLKAISADWGLEKAFEYTEKSHTDELAKLEKGELIEDFGANAEYNNALYQYLSKHRVRTVPEDLQFGTWRRFNEKFQSIGESMYLFFTQNLEQYLEKMGMHARAYAEVLAERSQALKKQIEALTKENPNATIVFSGGATRTPICAELQEQGYEVKEYFKPFVFSALTEVVRSHLFKKAYSEEKLRELISRAFPDFTLELRICSKLGDGYQSAEIAREISNRLTIEDVEERSKNLSERHATRPFEISGEISDAIYLWMEQKGKIKSGEEKYFK